MRNLELNKDYYLRICLFSLIVSVLFTGKVLGQVNKPLPQLRQLPLKELISAMTLEEKAAMVVGTGIVVSSELSVNNDDINNNKVLVPQVVINELKNK